MKYFYLLCRRLACRYFDLSDGEYHRCVLQHNKELRWEISNLKVQYKELAYICYEVQAKNEAYRKDFAAYGLGSALKRAEELQKQNGSKPG